MFVLLQNEQNIQIPMQLPVELEKYVTVLNIPLPDRFDIERTLIQVERQCKINLSVEMRNRIVDAALGMTTIEADLAFCLAAVKDDLGENAPYTVSSEKEQIICKSGILDYFPKNENLKDVGGMEVLKNWLFKRQKPMKRKQETLVYKNQKDYFTWCSRLWKKPDSKNNRFVLEYAFTKT